MESENKGTVIFCPHCKKRVAYWDGKSTSNVVAKCMTCRKQVVYYVDTGETKRIDAPKRRSSSGVSFT